MEMPVRVWPGLPVCARIEPPSEGGNRRWNKAGSSPVARTMFLPGWCEWSKPSALQAEITAGSNPAPGTIFSGGVQYRQGRLV